MTSPKRLQNHEYSAGALPLVRGAGNRVTLLHVNRSARLTLSLLCFGALSSAFACRTSSVSDAASEDASLPGADSAVRADAYVTKDATAKPDDAASIRTPPQTRMPPHPSQTPPRPRMRVLRRSTPRAYRMRAWAWSTRVFPPFDTLDV